MQIDGNAALDPTLAYTSTSVDPSVLELPGDPSSGAPLGSDAISSSPLTYFGGVVTQIGQSMIGAQANGGDESADMSRAVELLEGVIGLMSGVGSGDDGGDGGLRPLPSLASLPASE